MPDETEKKNEFKQIAIAGTTAQAEKKAWADFRKKIESMKEFKKIEVREALTEALRDWTNRHNDRGDLIG